MVVVNDMKQPNNYAGPMTCIHDQVPLILSSRVLLEKCQERKEKFLIQFIRQVRLKLDTCHGSNIIDRLL